ncbi:MAG: 4Fe-4S dicluster domain-containing protein [Desulfitobacteriaceae bacterium]
MELAMLVAKVQAAGVVGAGGGGFPTDIKLNTRCQTIIVNGAECEPLLQVDQQLLKVAAQELVEALALVLEATGAGKGVFALKVKYKEAVIALHTALKGRKQFEVFLLEDFYPAGDEQVLVYEVLGKVVPPGGIPLDIGAVVLNVETLLNIGMALQGIPVTHKYLTVTGAVAHPMTVRAPLGTPINHLIQWAGGATVEDYRILEGGPMMGKERTDREGGITKTTKGLIILPAEHRLWRNKGLPAGITLKRAMAACCQCSACTDLCPRYLLGHGIEPHRILRNKAHNISQDMAGMLSAQWCSECGACDYYACVMDLSPRSINVAIKQELAKQELKPSAGGTSSVHPQREQRKIPVKRLVARLGLGRYEQSAPLAAPLDVEKRVVLNLKQHAGSACYPLVTPGSSVERGQVVAEVPPGQLGSRIHASIAGTVRQVTPEIIIEVME